MLSAGRPVLGSVMASRLCQVSRAQRCRREFEAPGTASGRDAVRGLAPGAPVTLQIQREGRLMYVSFTLD
jgi:hypothetical protein